MRRANGCVVPDRWKESGWTAEQVALLGTLPDEELAQRIERTRQAVRLKRERLGIGHPVDERRRGPAPRLFRGTLHER